jgi:hypothetical protein
LVLNDAGWCTGGSVRFGNSDVVPGTGSIQE